MATTTSTSAILNWSDPNSASSWQVEYGTAGFTQGTGTMIVVSNPTTIPGLTPETDYDAYVRAICAVGDTSGWSSLVSFTTPCAPVALPLVEDFSSTGWVAGTGFSNTGSSIADCWTRDPATGFFWGPRSAPTGSSNTGPSGDHTTGSGNYVYTESSSIPSGTMTILESANIGISGTNTIQVSFWYHMHGANTGRIVLETRIDGGAWMPIDSLVGEQQADETSDWKQMSKTLTVSGSELKIRFRGVSGGTNSSDMAIDDLKVRSATTWTGTAWTNGMPNANTLAIIAGNYSNGSFTTDDLVLNSGVSFMPTADIDIKGMMTNNGANIGGAGFVTYSGAAAQMISGDFMKLKVNNAAGATITGPTSVSGVLKLENGTLTTNDNLTLASPSASECACLDTMKAGGGTLSGDVTVERSLPFGYDRWFYMATPVKGKFFGDLLLGNITFKPYNIYEYSPITNVDSGWVAADSFTALTPGQGAIAFGNAGKLDFAEK